MSHGGYRAFPVMLLALAACGGAADKALAPPDVPVAASIEAHTPQALGGTVGASVAQAPAVIVRDVQGAPIRGATVTFAVIGGGGSLVGSSATTNAGGVASVGGWTLGTVVGPNVLRATVGTLSPVDFTATAGPAAPASISASDGAAQVGTVGASPPVLPQAVVRDPFGNGVPGVTVTFAVGEGSGTIAGATAATDAAGMVRPGGWTLGTTAGIQAMTATVAGVPAPATFSVTARAGAPHAMLLVAGAGQMEVTGSVLPVSPGVQLADRYGNHVEGAAVQFVASSGSGTVAGASAATNATGVAFAGEWTLGPVQGVHTVEATVEGLPPLVIQAKAVPPSSFDIELRYLTAVSEQRRRLFASAVARWRKVIIGDLVDVHAGVPANFCGLGEPALDEVIDDVLVYVEVTVIDGEGGTVAQAGSCGFRTTDGMPALGVIRFDIADLQWLESGDQLGETILHEMGHIFGIGSAWRRRNLVAGLGTLDPYYTGASGRLAWRLAGGDAYTGNPVPVENLGGAGSRNTHWRTSVMFPEVMTAFIGPPGIRTALSLVTIGSLEDLGYLITPFGDDAYRYGDAREARGATPMRDRQESPIPSAPALTDRRGSLVQRAPDIAPRRLHNEMARRREVPSQQKRVQRMQ